MEMISNFHGSKLVAALILVALPAALLDAQVFDEISVMDGSLIIGEIQSMTDGVLTVKTAFGGDVKIAWSEVKSLKTVKPLPFVLTNGGSRVGVARGAEPGSIDITEEGLAEPSTIPLGSVQAINPPPVKPIVYKGNFSAGASLSDGNTQTRNFNLLGEFEARSERQRLTLRGAYLYAEDDDGVTARNGKAGIKYDFFITKRFYVYASSFFEHDGFQDLNLRTALSAGPGYQFIDKGDFNAEWAKEMQLYGEVGISYFDEDFKRAEDNTYVAGRWSIKFDWPFVPKRVTFFHFHEGYPGLERGEDLYITTETGLRFAIWNNFVAAMQVNWRWDNTPAPGFERSDTLYLATLGYSFEL